MCEGDDRPTQVRADARFPAPARTAVPDWYPELLDAVADCVRTGRQRAVSAANQQLVSTYWAVGNAILARQDAEGWGTRVIDRLSADLREQFPGTSGFSPRNLKYMRAFAAAWPDGVNVQARLAQLPWYHHVALLEKLDTAELRLLYAYAAIEQGWSRDVLVHHIDGRFHERAGRAITNFTRTIPLPDSDLAQQSTRDPYLFDFVGNADVRRERDLERALIDHVERFLLELGQGFAFVGKQVHLEIGDADFYTDLLFFHLKLRCFVVIELKVGDFDPSYLGQLGTYMAAVDDLLRHADDKATIGLLLCKTKNNVVAEYALAVTPRPSALRSGRPPSPRACPPSSNPAFPQSKSSKPSWQMSPTWLPKLPSSRKRIVVALAHAEATDGDLARVLSGATGDEDANVGTDAQGPGDPERRQASAKAFEEVFGRRPSSATDWATAEVLNPNSYDPLYQGAKPEIRVARIEPVPGQGAVRVSQVH